MSIPSRSSSSNSNSNSNSNSHTNFVQNASLVNPNSPDSTLTSDPTDLCDQIPPTPDHLVATVAPNPQNNPFREPLRAYLPAAAEMLSPPRAPASARFRDAVQRTNHHPVWLEDPNEDVPQPETSRRCSQQAIHPCFCHNNAERRGLTCDRCVRGNCSVYRLLQRGSVAELEITLCTKLARGRRGAEQLERDVQAALGVPRTHEAYAAAEVTEADDGRLSTPAAARLPGTGPDSLVRRTIEDAVAEIRRLAGGRCDDDPSNEANEADGEN
ncbi:hypothetical protein CDEST_02555 [Colletotrichum destructivum]|uniref:Uncharacterized protein n=1 Tax=Colletotrichum destructivum TaxID=34406 RepID=A0AAX4I2D9_9PEZI|nr:hypothetical protein CDEST_02555 [Colletotrichum destructivum]